MQQSGTGSGGDGLLGGFVKRVYCVQYRETDFQFICRLMEEEGIFYFFKHENGKHTMVLANAPTAQNASVAGIIQRTLAKTIVTPPSASVARRLSPKSSPAALQVWQ